MGTFITNFHVRGRSQEDVTAALTPLLKSDAYLAKSGEQWVTVCPPDIHDADALARELSSALSTVVFSTMVHDSDVLMYIVHDNGEEIDSYNSNPGYFDDGDEEEDGEEEDEIRTGSSDILARFAVAGVSSAQIRATLDHEELFVEKKLSDLAEHLGIDSVCVCASYRYLKRHPEDFDRNFAVVSPPVTKEYLTRKLIEVLDDLDPDVTALEKLIAQGADVNANYNNVGHNLLMHAINPHPKASAVDVLIKAGADVNHTLPAQEVLVFDGIISGYEGGTTPLTMAIAHVNPHRDDADRTIDLLIAAGANVNAKTDMGRTALSIARDLAKPNRWITRKDQIEPREQASERRVALLLAAGATE